MDSPQQGEKVDLCGYRINSKHRENGHCMFSRGTLSLLYSVMSKQFHHHPILSLCACKFFLFQDREKPFTIYSPLSHNSSALFTCVKKKDRPGLLHHAETALLFLFPLQHQTPQ